MDSLRMQPGCDCPSLFVGPTLAETCHGSSFILFMGLLDTFLRTQCDLNDPCGRVQSPAEHDNAYDFIVIGGGSAGAVAASRLSEEKSWKVLLLEAGGDEPPGATVPSMVINYWGTELDWGYKTQPEKKACLGYPDKRCQWTRGKVLGGCSVLNGMMYLRGHPRDYDQWKAAGNIGWGWSDVLPFFKKSEDNRQVGSLVDAKFHGVGGMMPVQQFPHHPPIADAILRAGAELGYPINKDLNGAQHDGFAITQTNNERGSRMSTARAFLRPVKHRPNLHILLNSTATRIVIDPKTKTASAVEFMRNGQKQVVRVTKEVVVSGGAVNSPQLLLLSGVGPKADLAQLGINLVHDLPGVGHNLHNHVAFYINFAMKNTTSHTDLNWASAMDYMLNRNGPMSSTGLSQITAKINSKYARKEKDDPDVQMFFAGYLANCARTGMVDEHEDPENPTKKRYVSFSPVVLHPKSRGYIKLASKDPLADPLIYPNYLTDDADVKTLVEACQIAVRLGKTKVLREEYGFELDTTPVPGCVKPGSAFGSDKYWECAVRHSTGPENHQAGSCKMGPEKDRMAVVNHELKVYGLKNVRVMDASVMPMVPSGNTNAPCMMIAEKGVDMIKLKWNVNRAPPSTTTAAPSAGGLGNRFGGGKDDMQQGDQAGFESQRPTSKGSSFGGSSQGGSSFGGSSPGGSSPGGAHGGCTHHNHGHPFPGPGMTGPGSHGPGMHGPGFHGPGMHGPGMHGPGFHGPGMHGPGMHGPGFHGPGMHGPGMHGPGFHGPGMHGPGFHGPGMHGPGMHGPGFHGPGMHGPGAHGPGCHHHHHHGPPPPGGGGVYPTPTPPGGGFTRPEGGNTRPEGGFTRPEGGFTRPEGGFTRPEGGFTRPVTRPGGGVRPTSPATEGPEYEITDTEQEEQVPDLEVESDHEPQIDVRGQNNAPKKMHAAPAGVKTGRRV